MPYGTLQADKVADSYNASLAPISVPFRNRILNGQMVIDQRNAGASVTPASGQYTLDRFYFTVAQASKLTTQQLTGLTTLPGFVNALRVTSSSAYTVGASEIFVIRQNIEGLNVVDFNWGTSNAATVTLSFWVRSSLTGVFGGAVKNSDSSRTYPFSYSISAANTWEQKSITIVGDSSGTWLVTNGIGISVVFSLGSGSSSSGTAGSWSSTNYSSVTGAVSVVGTNAATFDITGVQLEKGSTATSFDYRPYGTELQLCQRYYEKADYLMTASGYYSTSNWQVTKRAIPTINIITRSSNQGGSISASAYSPTSSFTLATFASAYATYQVEGVAEL